MSENGNRIAEFQAHMQMQPHELESYLVRIADEVVGVPKGIDVVGSFTNSLHCSKSSGSQLRFCEKQLQYDRFLQPNSSAPRPELEDEARFGINIHLILSMLMQPAVLPFDHLVFHYIDNTLATFILQQALLLIPDGEYTAWLGEILYNFACWEALRMASVFSVSIKESYIRPYIYPLCVELPVYNFDRKLMGIVDRVDLLVGGGCAIYDYKTGKVKIYDDEDYFEANTKYKRNYDKAEILYEIGFYACLLQQGYVLHRDNYYMRFSHKATKGMVLYLEDPQNSQYIPLISENLVEAESTIQRYFNSISNGAFKQNWRFEVCIMWCEYFYLCKRLHTTIRGNKIPDVQQAFEIFEEDR